MESIKCVIVGDGAIGKTSMLISYTTDSFPRDYVPTVFDNYQANVMVNGRPVQLNLWDTAGQEDYDRLRPLSYPNTDIFIIGYSVLCNTSFNNIKTKWLEELKIHCLNVPFIVVCTKMDILNNPGLKKQFLDNGGNFVDNNEAKKIAYELGALEFVECSAKTQYNLKEVFDKAITSALSYKISMKKKKKKKCLIL